MADGSDEGQRRLSHNRREVYRLSIAFVVLSGLAASAALGASLTGGVENVVLIIVAALLAALAAWQGLWTLPIAALVIWNQHYEKHSPPGG